MRFKRSIVLLSGAPWKVGISKSVGPVVLALVPGVVDEFGFGWDFIIIKDVLSLEGCCLGCIEKIALSAKYDVVCKIKRIMRMRESRVSFLQVYR